MIRSKITLSLKIIVATMFCISYAYSQSKTTKRTFYVDSKNGNDSNKGISPSEPWKTLSRVNDQIFKPGDSILFRAGGAWEGQLIPKGSGSEGLPIVISRYNLGKNPLIDGKGKVEQVIRLENVQQWELHHLEITNNSDKTGNRLGILIKSEETGLKKHFILKNLHIHDIMGDYSFEMKGKNTGGIGIIGGADTRFDEILIEDCEIGNINRVGIFTNLTNSKNAVRGNRPITNLIIRRNKIHHCAGDGLIIRYAFRPLIEYNIAYENHNAPEELVKHGVALWCRSTDEALFQYNEVYNTRGKMDGQAFDADLDAYRTVVQYNYSHGNEGGFMLVYGSSSESIVRYNISVNDGLLGKHIFDFPVWTKPRGAGIFHNNTIVIPKNSSAVIADEAVETAYFYNNIFYNQGIGGLFIDSNGQTATFSNNNYYGYDKNKISIVDPKRLLGNPRLVNPSRVRTGITNIKNFSLRANSPLVEKGIMFETDTYWLQNLGKTDLWGHPINKDRLTIGAFQPFLSSSPESRYSIAIHDTSTIITVNHHPVEKREFQREMKRYKAQIFDRFAQKYPLDGINDFWNADFENVKPSLALKKQANDALICIKVQQQLLTEYRLWPYKTYHELLIDLKKTNIYRKRAISSKQVLYGPVQFDELSFFDYQFSNAIISLKKILLQDGTINITDEDLKQHFNKMKQSVYKKDKYKFELFKTQVQDDYIEHKYNLLITHLTNNARVITNSSLYNAITFND